MNHFKSVFYKNVEMYSNIWWKHVHEGVGAHDMITIKHLTIR